MERTLTIRIPDTMKKELETLSSQEKKPVSDLVRESLRKYLAVKRFHQLRNMALPFAEAKGILTDDDVFSILS